MGTLIANAVRMKQYLTLLILSATLLHAQDGVIEKVARYNQSDASTTTLASSNPYGLVSEIIDVVTYTGGTVSWNNGSAQSLTFGEDAGDWLAGADFADKTALDAYAPDASIYTFSNADGTAVALTFDIAGIEVYPDAPLLSLTGGAWDSGTYVLTQGATFGWSTTLDITSADWNGWYMFGGFFGPSTDAPFDEEIGDGGDGVLSSTHAGLGAGNYTLEFSHGYIYDYTDPDPSDGELSGANLFAGLVSKTTLSVQVVPEPSQAAILFGLLAFGFVMLRRRAR